MSWRLFRKARLRALEHAEDKLDEEAQRIFSSVSRNGSLAPLNYSAGRLFIARWRIGSSEPESYLGKWHKVDKEEVELTLSRHSARRGLWFAVEPFYLSVAAEDADTAFDLGRRIDGKGAVSVISRRKDRYELDIAGPLSMNFPIDPVEGNWNGILEAAGKLMKGNDVILRKIGKMRW